MGNIPVQCFWQWQKEMNKVYKKEIALGIRPFVYALLGTLVGVAVGAAGGLFGAGIDFFSGFGMRHFELYVWFLPVVGVLTAFMLRKWGDPNTGMRAVFEASRGERDRFELRSAVFQYAGAWTAHLFCASVGREGAGIQIGAAIGCNIGRRIPIKNADKILLVAGMAAGFSALFGTPAAALFFALEVTVVGGLHLRALIASAFASYASYFVSRLCLPAHFSAEFVLAAPLSLSLACRLFAFGALCGLAGFVFCLLRKYLAAFFLASVRNEYVRAFFAAVLLACLLFLSGGRYSGLGTNLIGSAVSGGEVYWYDWIVKMLFTAAFLSVGFLGGEVTTLFAAGACLGAAAGELLGIPAQAAACLGYAGVFGAATNTVIAPVVLGCELFGGASLPYMAVVCVAAYLFNFGKSVYNQKVREDIAAKIIHRLYKKRPLELPRRLY